MKKFTLSFVIVAGFATLFACNQPNQKASQVATTPEGKTNENLAAVFPHSDDFKMKTHPHYFRKDPELCAKCHGKDWSGGNTQVSCSKCHGEKFPHPAAWALPTNHGESFTKLNDDDKKRCFVCHNADAVKTAKKGETKIACQNCHAAFPHTDEFKMGGHAEMAKTYEGKCTACHKGFTANMPNMKCEMCHAGKKLEIHWAEPAGGSGSGAGGSNKPAAPQSSRRKVESSKQSSSLPGKASKTNKTK